MNHHPFDFTLIYLEEVSILRFRMDLSQTIHLLGDLLGEVISELELPAIFEIEERIRTQAKARRNGEEFCCGGIAAGSLGTLHRAGVGSGFGIHHLF